MKQFLPITQMRFGFDKPWFHRLAVVVWVGSLSVIGGNAAAQISTATADKTYEAVGPLWPDFVILPQGFRYRVIADESTVYSDGSMRPGDADGMGAFPGPFGSTILCVSHELSNGETPVVPPVNNHYDPNSSGGTSVMMVGPDRSLLQAWVSSSGTRRNCAGGTTPWDTWITAEENEVNGTQYPHGWAFEVDPYAPLNGGKPRQIRLDALGRFYKEAVTVDPLTRAVYQTEDRIAGLFYRFMPADGTFPDGFGSYANALGQLEAMYIPGLPNANLANPGDVFSPQWIRVPDPIASTTPTRSQTYLDMDGVAVQPTILYRGEGASWSDIESAVYFDCTGGGSSGHLGQIWRYIPAINELTLVYESTDANILKNPDNLHVLPWGDLVICEDSGGIRHLRIMTTNGTIVDFARTSISEFAGASWSSNPDTLYVNLQSPSITLAIWGPFESLGK